MERTASPARSTRSTRSNLIRSYTTSSDISASEQLAAIAKAREERRKEREGKGRYTSHQPSPDDARDDLTFEGAEEDEEERQEVVRDSSTKSTDSSSSSLPKLRVHPTSDSSFTPSIPSTPSQSSEQALERRTGPAAEPDRSSSFAPSSLSRSFDVAEIPPFRPRSSSPTATSSYCSPASSPPPANVVLSGGLLERLKAQRAAQGSKTAAGSGTHSSSVRDFEVQEGSALVAETREGRPRGSAEADSTHEVPSRPSSSAPLDSPPNSIAGPSSPSLSLSDSVPPLTNTSTVPSSFIAPIQDEDERADAVSELSHSGTSRERNKSRSRIYGRYGEEIEYDFTALSDVQERSERSSMSTMQGSLWQNRGRQTAAPASGPTKSSNVSASSPPTDSDPSKPMSSSRSTPSLISAASRPVDLTVDRRVDATSQLLGKSRSNPVSIFASASNRGAYPSDTTLEREEVRPRSPVRTTSPEIARRASQFEVPTSPTKFAPLPPLPRAATVPLGIGIEATVDDSTAADDDRLREIEKRRTARRARLDSIRKLYAPQAELGTVEVLGVERDGWAEVEHREQAQAVSERRGKTTLEEGSFQKAPELVTSFAPSVSEDTPILCEGHISIPLGGDGAADLEPSNWVSRYSVLDSKTLSFRPTDQTSLSEPLVVLNLADCDRVEEEPTPRTSGGPSRPFAVVLKSGERVRFACDRGSERVRWLLALENAIEASSRGRVEKPLPAPILLQDPRQTTQVVAVTSPRSITTPQASFRDPFCEDNEELGRPPLAPRAEAVVSRQVPTPTHSIWSEIQPRPVDPTSVIAALQAVNVSDPSSRHSRVRPLSAGLINRFDQRPLPKSPSLDPPLQPTRGHQRSRSDLSCYRTPDHAPPHRPSPTRPKSFHFRSEPRNFPVVPSPSARSESSSSSITYRDVPSVPTTQSRRVPEFKRASREIDNETLTTRRGVDTASEKARWKQTLQDYENEARQYSRSELNSRNEPGVVDRITAIESAMYDGAKGDPAPVAKSGFRLSLGKKATTPSTQTSDYFAPASTSTRRDPFATSKVVQPQPERRSQVTERHRPDSTSTSAHAHSDASLAVEDLLWKIRDGLENQRTTFQDDKARQELQAQAISALARWVTEDTRVRQAEYSALGQAVEDVVQQIAALPRQLCAVLQDGYADAAMLEETAKDDVINEGAEEPVDVRDDSQVGARLRKKNSGRGFGINPLSSFAKPDPLSVNNEVPSTSQPKLNKSRGPRMPVFRMWGAPEPLGDRDDRWGRRSAPALDSEAQAPGTHVAPEARVERLGDAPLTDTLRRDPQVRETLAALNGKGGELDTETLSHAVYEILRRLRDIGQKQADQANRITEEHQNPSSLHPQDVADAEARRAELAHIEQVTSLNAERTSKLDEMVTRLAKKSEKTESLLSEIAKSVKEGRNTTMDPALSGEVKKLLSGVQSGVDAHVADFRGKLTSEVQRMFKEVGKLRDEKKTLQTEIAELMAFHAKYGGTTAPKPIAHATSRDETQAPTQDRAPAATSTFGFYGPRPLK